MKKNKWFLKSNQTNKIFGPWSKEKIEKVVQNSEDTYAISANGQQWRNLPCSPRQKFIGKYKVEKELGRGGMGVVFLVWDQQLQRHCALKALLPEMQNNVAAVQRFRQEALAVAKINHPNIIKIYEICDVPHCFFVMEFIDGVPFDQFIAQKTLKQKLQIFCRVCEAVEHAHKNDILHRDLKPDNILVSKDGKPIVLDFGIAKDINRSSQLTKTGDIFGTPKYMSPEAARCERVNESSDVYSLGVILYEMITGRVPFDGENSIELLFRLTTEDPIAPSQLNISIKKESNLEVICLAALEKKASHRIANVALLRREILATIKGHSISLKPPSYKQKFVKWCKNNVFISFAFSALVVAVFVLIFCIAWGISFYNTKIKEGEQISKQK